MNLAIFINNALLGVGMHARRSHVMMRVQGNNLAQILHQSGETPKAPIMGVRKEHQNKNRSQ